MTFRGVIFSTFLVAAGYYGTLFWSFNPEAGQWQKEASSPIKRFEGTVALVGDDIYNFFGYMDYIEQTHTLVATNDVSSFNAKTKTWTTHKPGPFSGTHLNAAADGPFVYFVGGFEGNHPGPAVDYFNIYDSETDSWRSGPPLPEKRGGGALARVGRSLHYIGGYFAAMEEPSSEKHWAINLDDLQSGWSRRADLPNPRGHAGTVELGGYIYIIGGSLTHHPTWIDSELVHRYDPQADKWEQVASLPYEISHTEPGTFVHEGKIIMAGGRNGTCEKLAEFEIDDVFAYTPETDSWELIGTLPKRLRAPVMRISNNQAFVMTGSTYWAQKMVDDVYSVSCKNNSVCGSGPASDLRLAVKRFHKNLTRVMPLKAQKLLKVEEVAF